MLKGLSVAPRLNFLSSLSLLLFRWVSDRIGTGFFPYSSFLFSLPFLSSVRERVGS